MTNFNDIVAEAVKAVGADDWRVQAGAVAALVLAGVLCSARRRVVAKVKQWRKK